MSLDTAALEVRVFKPMVRGDVRRVQLLVSLETNPAVFCILTRSIPLAALVAPVVWVATTMAMVAHTSLGFLVRVVSGGESRLAPRFTLRALQLLEVLLLPGVHDHLRGREQSRQRRHHLSELLAGI